MKTKRAMAALLSAVAIDGLTPDAAPRRSCLPNDGIGPQRTRQQGAQRRALARARRIAKARHRRNAQRRARKATGGAS